MSISVSNLAHYYGQGSLAVMALHDITLKIEPGEFVGIIGQSGSGKSTLVQHFNRLLKPSSGTVFLDDCDINAKKVKISLIRRRIGMVFQYPEQQLFEETVLADVAFGLRNKQYSSAEVQERVNLALTQVGLSFDKVALKSPLHLSGGERRRVAIAGVLVMEPDYLILDEPTANLDPRGREAVLALLQDLNKGGMTIILVSHSMEEVAKMVKRVFVMNRGNLVLAGSLNEVFAEKDELEALGLGLPQIVDLMQTLKRKGKEVEPFIFTPAAAAQELLRRIKKNA